MFGMRQGEKEKTAGGVGGGNNTPRALSRGKAGWIPFRLANSDFSQFLRPRLAFRLS